MIAFKGRKPKMKMSVHALAMETFVPALRTLSELLDKGVEPRTQRELMPQRC